MMRDDLIDLGPVVQALQSRDWNSRKFVIANTNSDTNQIEVEIVKAESPVENFNGIALPANTRMFAGTLIDAMIIEIEHDLNSLAENYPNITNYRIGMYQSYGYTVRFSKHYYTA